MSFPFGSAENYPQMLKVIAVYIFIYITIVLLILSNTNANFHNLATIIPLEIQIQRNSIPISVFLVAITTAFFSRTFKLHDKISDFFKVRALYDIENIIIPLAEGVQFNMSEDFRPKAYNTRSGIMNSIFYKYASSTGTNSVIDKHLIIMALEQLTTLWVLVELAFFNVLFVIACLILKHYTAVPWSLGITVLKIVIAIPVLNSCRKYTRKEVEAILDDPNRVTEIREALNAL